MIPLMSAADDFELASESHQRTDTGVLYDPSTLVADPAPWYESWRDGSKQARRRRSIEARTEIAYGNRPSERFDLYRPDGNTRILPFVAFVHGVGWRRSIRADAGFPALALVRMGFAFVAIGFDDVPAVDLAGQADQVRRAWRFLIQNADNFGIDAARGHLLGHSSGAHLAALAAFDPLASCAPASAVLLSGVYDLEPVRLGAGNGDLGLDRETSAKLSPARLIPTVGPSLVVAWGSREPDELRRQSRDFASACRARGLSVLQAELPGRNHFDTSLELATPHSPVLESLRARK